MSRFFKTEDEAKEVQEDELIKELCEHLRQIGISATVVEQGSPEDIGGLVAFSLGSVKVDGRNIDLVQVERTSVAALQPKLQPGQPGYTEARGQGSTRYDYHYLLRAKVAGLENKLQAEFKPVEKRKGLFGKEAAGFQWEGGELAQRLNSNADLKDMLLKEAVQRLWIVPEKKQQCVRITPLTGAKTVARWDFTHHPTIIGRKAFPTREAFEIYDKIAQQIRSIASARP